MLSRPSLSSLLLYFLRLGALGFGGPIALAGAMQRDLVEDRGWVTPDEYREGLALAQLMPGPLAAQLAIYLGWVRFGISGATIVAIAFALPSLLIVLASLREVRRHVVDARCLLWCRSGCHRHHRSQRPLGGIVAAIAVYLPCYFLVIVPAPYFRRFSSHVGVRAFVDGVTAAAVGAIGGAALVLGKRAIYDFSTATIALVAYFTLLRFRRLPEPILILTAGLIGIALTSL